jgi:hypothetical protein
MTIEKLIDEYRELARNCYQVDFSDRKAVKKNNDSVTRMYTIVDRVIKEFGSDGISKLKTLLDIEDHHTNVWIATHLLENITLEKTTEDKALGIIEKVASGDDVMALGYQYWIKGWKSTREK